MAEELYDWVAGEVNGIRGSLPGDGGLWCKGFPTSWDSNTRVVTTAKAKYYLFKDNCCTVGQCAGNSEKYLSTLHNRYNK